MKNDQVITLVKCLAWDRIKMAPMKYFSNKFSDYSVFITYLQLKKQPAVIQKRKILLNSLILAKSVDLFCFSSFKHVSAVCIILRVIKFQLNCSPSITMLLAFLLPFALCVFIHRKCVPDWKFTQPQPTDSLNTNICKTYVSDFENFLLVTIHCGATWKRKTFNIFTPFVWFPHNSAMQRWVEHETCRLKSSRVVSCHSWPIRPWTLIPTLCVCRSSWKSK